MAEAKPPIPIPYSSLTFCPHPTDTTSYGLVKDELAITIQLQQPRQAQRLAR
ncbi:MAG: hypothetical protein WCF33_03160 [Pseudonocardiaceae bacterium]